MKKMLWLLLIPLALAALLIGCADNGHTVNEEGGPHPGTPGQDPVDGGVTDNSDPDAPKTIESKQLTLFDCRFSTMDAAEPGALGNHIYELQAKLENGAVKGSYRVADTGEERLFRESHEFLDELRSLIEMYDLAQHNGHERTAAGIPDEYGARLEAQYASRESIYAVDNQDNFLSPASMDALVRLFERGAAIMPITLSISVETQYVSEPTADGYGEIRYPVYHLQEESYPALSAALAALNEARLEDVSDEAEELRAEGGGQLSLRTDAFVTRSDNEVVSFYERTERRRDAEREQPATGFRTHNLDARTGRELKFSDVFRDMEHLPGLLLTEFEKEYPGQTFYDGAAEYIRQSVEADDGNICFALGYGCVHVFADEYVLNDAPGGQHITLSFVLEPEQVRAFYLTAPGRWLIPLDYDTVYWRSDVGVGFRMRFFDMPEGDGVLWVVTVEGGEAEPYEEMFYGRAPTCWLVREYDRDFIYLRVTTGDISMLTKIYEVTQQAVTKRTYDTEGLAMRPDTPLDPDRMLMYLNEPVFAPSMMLPYGTFRAERNGLPEASETVYLLDGPWVRLREGGRYNSDGTASGGTLTLAAGERLRPYRTDMKSFLDFMTEDGRTVRFAIDKWADDMRLDELGTPEEVFEPEGVG